MTKGPLNHAAKDVAFTSKAAVISLAAGIPIVGPQFATAVGIWEGERISRRVEAFIEEVEARIGRLEQDKLNRAYIDSEDFRDAVISAVQAAKKSSSAEKRAWVAATLLGAASSDRPPQLDAEAILDTLAGMTEPELAILAWVSKAARPPNFEFFSANVPRALQGPDFNFHIVRIQSAGMVTYRTDLPQLGSDDRRMFQITSTFQRLMWTVEAGGGLRSAT